MSPSLVRHKEVKQSVSWFTNPNAVHTRDGEKIARELQKANKNSTTKLFLTLSQKTHIWSTTLSPSRQPY